MDKYNLGKSSAYNIRWRLDVTTFEEAYNELEARDKLKEELATRLLFMKPSVLAPIFDGNNKSSSSIDFVRRLYSTKDKGVIFNKSKELMIKAKRYLDELGL